LQGYRLIDVFVRRIKIHRGLEDLSAKSLGVNLKNWQEFPNAIVYFVTAILEVGGLIYLLHRLQKSA
jgi:hypothetical protein